MVGFSLKLGMFLFVFYFISCIINYTFRINSCTLTCEVALSISIYDTDIWINLIIYVAFY